MISVLVILSLLGLVQSYHLYSSRTRLNHLSMVQTSNFDSSNALLQSDYYQFDNLRSESFAHPLDIRITRRLSRIPFLESTARTLFSSVEQAMIVDNLGSAVLVGPNQMPSLYESLKMACKALDMTEPDLYVKQNPSPNAYTLAYRGRKPFIVIHTGLLDLLDEKEVKAVIGHELGHLKCEHGVWLTLLNFVVNIGNRIAGPLFPFKTLLQWWQRSAEYSCDRASLLVSQDHKVVASVLMKLCGGSSKNSFSKELNVDAFLEQAKQLEEEKRTLVGSFYSLANDRFSTHPIPLIRAIELVKWSEGQQYQDLLRKAKKISPQI